MVGTSRAEVLNLAIKKESFIDDFSSILGTDKINIASHHRKGKPKMFCLWNSKNRKWLFQMLLLILNIFSLNFCPDLSMFCTHHSKMGAGPWNFWRSTWSVGRALLKVASSLNTSIAILLTLGLPYALLLALKQFYCLSNNYFKVYFLIIISGGQRVAYEVSSLLPLWVLRSKLRLRQASLTVVLSCQHPILGA